jgi:hypothetical protein
MADIDAGPHDIDGDNRLFPFSSGSAGRKQQKL